MSAIPPPPAVDTGYRLSNGCPAIKVKVWGVFPQLAKEFEAILDTGFTGFLSLPILEALPLGLVLASTTKVSFADGSTDTNLVAWGNISLLSGQQASGLILLEQNPSPILLGMSFLNQFQRTLIIFGEKAIPVAIQSTTQQILLVNNLVVHQLLEAVLAQAQKSVSAEPVTETQALGESPPIPPKESN